MVDEIMATDDAEMLAYWSKRYPEKAATEIKRLRREVELHKSQAKMLSTAWLRELGGKLIPKAHHIDSLVVTTRHIVGENIAANQRIEELEGALRDCINQIRTDERRFSEEKFGINWMDAAEDCQITLSKHAHLIGGEIND